MSVNGGLDLIPDQQIATGAISAKPSSNGNHKVDFEISTGYRYEGMETFLALFFGTAGAPSVVDTSAYQHVLKPKADFDGIFSTIAYEYLKDALVGVLPSAKFTSLTISGKQGERIKISMKGMANTFTDASASNTTTTIDTVTLPSVREYATFPQAAWLMNDQTAGTLAATPIYVQGFELNLERPHKENVTTEFANKSGEFLPSGFLTGKGKIEFAVAQNGTGGNALFLADQMAGTAKKAKLTLTSAVLAGAATQMYALHIWMPYMQLLPGAKPVPSEAGAIAWSQDFELHHVGTIPTGFTAGYTDIVTVDLFSKLATDALA